MPSSNNNLNLADFVSNLNNSLTTGNFNYINNYIKDILSQSLNLSTSSKPQANDSLNLSDLIEDALKQSITYSLDQFTTQFGKSTANKPPIDHIQPSSSSSYRHSNKKIEEDYTTEQFETSSTLTEEHDQNNSFIEEDSSKHSLRNDKDVDFLNSEEISEDKLSPYEFNDSQSTVDHPTVNHLNKVRYVKPFETKIDIQPQVFQTHNSVVIRISIPEGIEHDHFRINVHDNYASIKWESDYMQQIIKLPSRVLRDDAVSLVKDNVLEVIIPKAGGI